MTRRLSLLAAPAAAVLVLAGISTAPAAAVDLNCVWTGAGADALWSTPGNWTGCAGGAPGAGDSLEFPAGAAQQANENDLFGTVFAGVSWSGSGYQVSGDPVETAALAVSGATTVNADIRVHQAAPNLTLPISANLTVQPGHALVLQQDPGESAEIALSGGAALRAAIGGSGETLRVDGDGTLTTLGNTYAGALALAGTAQLRCGGAGCGPATGALRIDEGASLLFIDDTDFPRPIELGANGPTTGVSLDPLGNAVSLDGLLTVSSDAAITGGTGAPLLLAGGVALGANALGVTGNAELPTFAQLSSTADGALRVGDPATATAFTIRDGQPNHQGATGALGAQTTLTIGDDSALGPGGGTPTSIADGAELAFDGTFALDEQVHVDADSRIVTATAGSTVTVNDLVLHDGGRVDTGVEPSAISLAGVSGTGPLRLGSAGPNAPILFDAGGSSSYTGLTVAESGTVALNRDTSVTGDLRIVDAHVTTVHTNADDLHDAIPDTATVTIDGGDLVINDNERIGALAGAGGAILLVSANSGLTVAGDAQTVWGGDLRGPGALTHEGAGSLRLDGDWVDNADGSRLLVEQGFVAAHGAMPETDATVQGRLGGTDTLRSITLDGGVLAPGDLAPGCIDVATSVGGTGTMEFELGGLGDCESDRVTAAVQHLAQVEWQFSFVNGYLPKLGDVFALVTTSGQGSDAIQTQDFVVDGVTLRLSADAERVILTVVDVPGDEHEGEHDGDEDGADDGGADGSPVADRGEGLARTGGGFPVFGYAVGLSLLLAAGALLLTRRRLR